MFHETGPAEKTPNADRLCAQAKALLAGCDDAIANAANLSALIYHSFAKVNWAGFYFLRNGRLVVGPFQGKPACVEIPFGKGVCGTAAASLKVQRVADVHAFPGHITCDPESRSEIVLPLVHRGDLIGVLDVDSPEPDRFQNSDQRLLEMLAALYIQSLG
ncbi:MAG: GAF domain-containing protein [Xanthomonadales bacterium]|jgi:GAF domain-containing protein|nr:GAF domain-containing protein [Xanthomonadales bacterium]